MDGRLGRLWNGLRKVVDPVLAAGKEIKRFIFLVGDLEVSN